MIKTYKALPLIAMAYITTKLIALLLFYKVITIFSVQAAASTLIIPLWFCLGDVITEIYGYKIAKKLVFMSVICQLIFGWLPAALNLLPMANISDINQLAYSEVLGNLPRGATASFLAIIIGGLVNAFILNKWRIMLNGKYFFIRSLGSTAIGELVFTVCVYVIGFHGLTSLLSIGKLILVSYVIKIVVNPIMILPISIITKFIKTYEHQSETNSNRFQSFKCTKPNQKFTKLYTRDGKSYFADEKLTFDTKYDLGLYSKQFSASSFMVRDIEESIFLDWHTIQQPQYVIYLSGELEIKASGGETRTFSSGDILFFNDLTGQGHITRIISAGKAVVIKE